jgi:hypothetical protein
MITWVFGLFQAALRVYIRLTNALFKSNLAFKKMKPELKRNLKMDLKKVGRIQYKSSSGFGEYLRLYF